jgi:hypothetical protein
MFLNCLKSFFTSYLVTEVVSLKNVFVADFTILYYITALIIFFWNEVSTKFEKIILDKFEPAILVLKQTEKDNPGSTEYIIESLRNNTEKYREAAQLQYAERNAYNLQLLQTDLLPVIYGFLSILFVISILMIIMTLKFNKSMFTRIEFILVLFTLPSFAPEVVSYFCVIDNWEFVGDQTVYKNLLFV